MLTTEQINDLHRLYWSEHWPIRKIERHLNMSWRTIKKYLDAPTQTPAKRERPSKLDQFKGNIAEWIEKILISPAPSLNSDCNLWVIVAATAFCASIYRKFARRLRPSAPSCAWNLSPENVSSRLGPLRCARLLRRCRKLYAFALVDGHSRKLYAEF